MKTKSKIKFLLGGAALISLLLLLFYAAYTYDNKYTAHSDKITSLSDHWEYCAGHLYTPEDFHAEDLTISSELIYIGEFGGFSGTRDNSEPFGQATYHKILELKNISDPWAMILPEIFSASKIYVNDQCVAEYGDFSPYSMQTGNSLIFLPSGTAEITILTANQSHYYSGMIYPPLLGPLSEIQRLIAVQLLLYGLFCFFSLGISIASISLWRRRGRNLLHIHYGLLCLFFSIHISYPFIHWLRLGSGELSYIAEDSSYYAMVLCITLLTGRLTRMRKLQLFHKLAVGISGTMILSSVLFPYILFPVIPQMILVYGWLISLFKLYISLYLIAASLAGMIHNTRNIWLLYGNAMFGAGIFADLLTGGTYEPIRFAWLDEYASFIMVIFFTFLILKTNRELAEDHENLTSSLHSEVEKKTEFLTRLLDERRSFLSSAAHDLKAPATVIQTYVDYICQSNTQLDEETKNYLAIIGSKTDQIKENILTLQLFNTEDQLREPPLSLNCNTFLTYVYNETLPYADANGIYYTLKLPPNSPDIRIQQTKLFRALENIIINATEHTPVDGKLSLTASYGTDTAMIKISDNGHGISEENLSHVFNYKFTTHATAGGHGIGLYFARISIEECGGSISVTSIPEKETSFTIILPVASK